MSVSKQNIITTVLHSYWFYCPACNAIVLLFTHNIIEFPLNMKEKQIKFYYELVKHFKDTHNITIDE